MKKMLMTATVPSMIGQFNMGNIDILLKMGYEVHVACNFRDYSCWPKERIAEFVKELKKLKVKYHHIEYSRSPKSIGKMIKFFRQLDRLIKTENFTFVHCHTPIAGVLARICCHRNEVKVIYTAHGFHFYDGAPMQNWLLYYPVEKLLSRWTDILITINREDYKRAKNNFCAKNTVYVPGIGVDIEKFENGMFDSSEKRTELGLDSESIMLLSVGELSARKNHGIVIKALAKMNNPLLHYFVAGKGELKKELEALAGELEIAEQVHLLGFRSDISELCHAADLFVFPSHQEGCPVALMEAIACRTPVMCSKIRGNTDLVKDEARLFDEGSVDDVVRCIRQFGFRRSEADNMETYRVTESNFENLKRFDLKKVESEMESLYSEMISSCFAHKEWIEKFAQGE